MMRIALISISDLSSYLQPIYFESIFSLPSVCLSSMSSPYVSPWASGCLQSILLPLTALDDVKDVNRKNSTPFSFQEETKTSGQKREADTRWEERQNTPHPRLSSVREHCRVLPLQKDRLCLCDRPSCTIIVCLLQDASNTEILLRE